jgi:hypothetical protein
MPLLSAGSEYSKVDVAVVKGHTDHRNIKE